jgi:hypothetical protein
MPKCQTQGDNAVVIQEALTGSSQVTQVVELLPSKCKALSSNSSTKRKEN